MTTKLKCAYKFFLILLLTPIAEVELLEDLPDTILRGVKFLSSMPNENNKNLPRRIDKHIELTTTLG